MSQPTTSTIPPCCPKCGKYTAEAESRGDRFKVCFCGAPGQRRFRRLFPEYANMADVALPRPRRVRTRGHRVSW